MNDQPDIFDQPTTEIVPQEKKLPVASSPAENIMGMIQSGLDKGIEPEKMGQMLDLYERMLAKHAQAEFVAALGDFQARCPTIQKKKEVKNRSGLLLYKYAPLEDVIEQVKNLLVELGFSYSFNTHQDENGTTVSCTLRHAGGHHEVTMVTIPATKGMNTNAAQDQGIQITFGRRYAFCGALGICTADEDRDGHSQGLKPITTEQADRIKDLIRQSGADEDLFLTYMEAEEVGKIQAADYEKAIAALHQKLKQKEARK